MTDKELITAVADRTEVGTEVVAKVLSEAWNQIIYATVRGETVTLRNFCRIRPHLRRLRRTPGKSIETRKHTLGVSLKPAPIWKNRLLRRLDQAQTQLETMESVMEKYGYDANAQVVKTVQEQQDEKARCPHCGAELQGQPPVCPEHGSEPFETRIDED
jgi:nucleoid DNA-binding protein